MDFNKLAQESYTRAYYDEMRKLASGEETSGGLIDSVPAVAALASLPYLMNKGSIHGRQLGLKAPAVTDWLMQKHNPKMGLGSFANKALATRGALPTAGTIGGALAGAGGAALLYNLLKDNWD